MLLSVPVCSLLNQPEHASGVPNARLAVFEHGPARAEYTLNMQTRSKTTNYTAKLLNKGIRHRETVILGELQKVQMLQKLES